MDLILQLIPATANQSTKDQIAAVNGEVWRLNPAFNDMDSLSKALDNLDPTGLVPTTIKRMFHPKSFGYNVIADFNIRAIVSSATGIAANQTQAVAPPTVHIDQGNLNCMAQHNDGDPAYYFDVGGANVAIANFCDTNVASKLVLGPGGVALQEAAENDGVGHTLDISATWTDGPNCPAPMDFSQDGAGETCKARLLEVIHNCALQSTSPFRLWVNTKCCKLILAN